MTFKELLQFQMDNAWRFIMLAMNDIDDEMLHWEPAPNCWGLRNKEGRWCLDFYEPEPIPPGPKTIGWLAGHLAACKEMHYDLLFGKGKKDWDNLVIPSDTEGMREYLQEVHQPLHQALDNLDIKKLEKPAPHENDDGKKIPVWQVYWYGIYHDFEHGGQIFQIKNEYHSRCGLYT